MDSNEEILRVLSEVLRGQATLTKQVDSIQNSVHKMNAKMDEITNYESFCQDVTGGGDGGGITTATTSIMKGRVNDFDDIEEQEDTSVCSCVVL